MVPTLHELELVCQKPRWREVGSWLARRVARPAALRLTRLIVRWPISANGVTAVALVVGVSAAVLIGLGRPSLFIVGAALLNLWYLLDHVDGQVARFHGRESVTGVFFDFMMHHIVHAAVAFSLGFGLARQSGELAWTLAGATFALGVTALALANDCKYKAFFSALARSDARLRSSSCPRTSPHGNLAAAARFGRLASLFIKLVSGLHRAALPLCEIPNIVAALTILAVALSLFKVQGLLCVQLYVLALGAIAPVLAIARIAKEVWLRRPDAAYREFLGTTVDENPTWPRNNAPDRAGD